MVTDQVIQRLSITDIMELIEQKQGCLVGEIKSLKTYVNFWFTGLYPDDKMREMLITYYKGL